MLAALAVSLPLLAPSGFAVAPLPAPPPLPPLPPHPSPGGTVHEVVDPVVAAVQDVVAHPPGPPALPLPVRDVGFNVRPNDPNECVIGAAFYAQTYTDSPDSVAMIDVRIESASDVGGGQICGGISVFPGLATGQLIGADFWDACLNFGGLGTPWDWATQPLDPCHVGDFDWAELRGTVGTTSLTTFDAQKGRWLHQQWVFGGVRGDLNARTVSVVIGNGAAF